MCDYSLHGIRNRLGVEGEKVVLTKFHTGTKGFTPCPVAGTTETKPTPSWRNFWGMFVPRVQQECSLAVCMPEGAILHVGNFSPYHQRLWNIQKAERLKFVQLSLEANTHRDGVQFPDGRCISLQELPIGLRATVLSLGEHEEIGVSVGAQAERGGLLVAR